MTKRLQVVLQDADYRAVKHAAKARHMTIAEWLRQALALARCQEPSGSVTKKLAAVRTAARHSFPAGDIGQMLEEIEAGYRSGTLA